MKRYASLLGGLGAVAVVFALVSFVIQLLSGGGLLLQRDLAFSVANLAVGLALLAVSLGGNLEQIRERMKSGEARRAGKYGTSAVLATVLGIALLGMLAFLSTRYHQRWDWTEAKSHSLTDQTKKVLAGLDQPVKVTALFAQIAAAEAKDLLERYSGAAPDKFQVEYVDPQAQPGRLAELGVEAERLEGGLLHVALGAESVDVKEVSEVALTQAIVKLTRQEQKKVYFLDGHNERVIDGDKAAEGDGMKDAAEALRNENYQVETLLLAAKGDVPADANVVIAGGPTRPLHESEHAALERYMERGGALLVLLDPRAGTDLGVDLARWGVERRRRRDRGPACRACSAGPPRPSRPSTATTRSRATSATPPCSTSRAACCPPRAPRARSRRSYAPASSPGRSATWTACSRRARPSTTRKRT